MSLVLNNKLVIHINPSSQKIEIKLTFMWKITNSTFVKSTRDKNTTNITR